MTHPTEAEAMREACARVAETICDDAGDPDGFKRRIAFTIRALPLPLAPAPLATPESQCQRCEMCGGMGGRHVEGKRGYATFPCPNATPADDAVARALRDIKAMSLGHHAHEDPAVLLHALLVEIPTAIDAALLAAERAAGKKGG